MDAWRQLEIPKVASTGKGWETHVGIGHDACDAPIYWGWMPQGRHG